MKVVPELLYSPTHEWVKKTSKGMTCGITDHAQSELSDIVFVELPDIGKKVAKGDTLCVVESVKAASDIYAPVSGTVIEVNEALSANPEKLNADPYGEGWICVLKPSNDAELNDLLSAEKYTEQLKG
jgi:glycine cleavage system H protein